MAAALRTRQACHNCSADPLTLCDRDFAQHSVTQIVADHNRGGHQHDRSQDRAGNRPIDAAQSGVC
jgi:hypothetical protein